MPSHKRDLPPPTPPEGPDPYGNPDPDWLRIDWREHLRRTEVRGVRVNYAEVDPGAADTRPIVFVHGLAGCWQNWLEQLPALGSRHRVLALDLPGSGASPMPPWDLTIESLGALVRDFCEATGAGDAILVGNSLGGFVAAEAVHRSPDRFAKLVLVSAAGISSRSLQRGPLALAGRLAVGLAPLALRWQEQGLRRRRIRHRAFRTVYYKPTELRRELLYEQYANGSGRPGFLASLLAVAGYDFTEDLRAVETPALIVWGRNDLIVPPADAAEYAALLRNSGTVIMDRTGHCPQLERPVRFNRLLEAFASR